MEEGVGEECGVGAYYLKESSIASTTVPINLVTIGGALQHRGQKSAGISTYNPHGRSILTAHKDIGLVSKVFHYDNNEKANEIMQRCSGVAGIVHTRYTTCGNRNNLEAARDEVQPFERRHGKLWKRFSLAFNGNLANYDELLGELKTNSYSLDTETDTEVLLHLFALEIQKTSQSHPESPNYKPNLTEVFRNLTQKLDGCYNLVSMFADGNLIVMRDPHGFRPLVWGQNKEAFAIASESRALERIGINDYQDVNPGELLIINSNGITLNQISEPKRSFCHFEAVYFSKASSRNDGIHVRTVRENLGRELAINEPLRHLLNDEYVVVPAPSTAIPAAQAYAEALGVKFRLSIEKDESLRGFINDKADREKIMERVYVIHREDIKDKKVIVVDDSIVRGDTSKRLIKKLREEGGAKEIHFRSTDSPIRHPCFYGIDFADPKQLIANQANGTLEQSVAKLIGADSVVYQTIDGLVRAIGIPKSDLCLACLTGKYPTSEGMRRTGQ